MLMRILFVCLFSFFLSLSFTVNLFAQETLGPDQIRSNIIYFTLEEGSFNGPGADSLLTEIKESQFTALGEMNRWALIDLRPLRQLLKDGSLTANDFETREIMNYDVVLIMPDNSRVTPHY